MLAPIVKGKGEGVKVRSTTIWISMTRTLKPLPFLFMKLRKYYFRMKVANISSPPDWLDANLASKFLYFFGMNFFLSNMYPSPFCIDNLHFSCVEQYYLYKQCEFFKKDKLAQAILESKDPKEMKRLSKTAASRLEKKHLWYPIAAPVMFKAAMAKFSQNPHLKDQLLATQNEFLVECNPRDSFWGIALPKVEAQSTPPDKWPGLNMLGKVLMSIRKIGRAHV